MATNQQPYMGNISGQLQPANWNPGINPQGNSGPAKPGWAGFTQPISQSDVDTHFNSSQTVQTLNGQTPTNNSGTGNIGGDITPGTSPATQSGNQASPFGTIGSGPTTPEAVSFTATQQAQGNQTPAVDFSNVQNPYSQTGFIDPAIRNQYTNLLGDLGSAAPDLWNQAFTRAYGMPNMIQGWAQQGQPGMWGQGQDLYASYQQMLDRAGQLPGQIGQMADRNPQLQNQAGDLYGDYQQMLNRAGQLPGQISQWSDINPALQGRDDQTFDLWKQAYGNAQGLSNKIDDWTQVQHDDIVRAMTGVANDRASRGIMAGTEAENLRANVLAKLAADARDKNIQLKTQAEMALPGIAGQGLGYGQGMAGLDQNTRNQLLGLQAQAAQLAPQMAQQGLGIGANLTGLDQETRNQILGLQAQAAQLAPQMAQQGLGIGADLTGQQGNYLQNLLGLKTQAAGLPIEMTGQGMNFLGDLLGMGRESYQEDPAAWGNIVSNLIRAGFTG